MPNRFNDIAAVAATSDYPRALGTAKSWCEPDLEPVEGVAEWQITAIAWLQLITDPDGNEVSFVAELLPD